jgi:hypothetical protein
LGNAREIHADAWRRGAKIDFSQKNQRQDLKISAKACVRRSAHAVIARDESRESMSLKNLSDFFDEHMLQLSEFERFPRSAPPLIGIG